MSEHENIIVVTADKQDPTRGYVSFLGQSYPCMLGKSGLIAAQDKREGDGASPMGVWPLRCVYYRQDKIEKPETALDIYTIQETDGWCDTPEHQDYNQRITLPHTASYEDMCRKDDVYDIVVPLGYNDAPPVAGRGSAIFLHVMRPEKTPTEGCVALALDDVYAVLKNCDSQTQLSIGF